MGVESELGHGSTFWFTVGFAPQHASRGAFLGPSQQDSLAQIASAPSRALSVLLAEDNKVNQKVAVPCSRRRAIECRWFPMGATPSSKAAAETST